jgi:hypothetical protein
MMKASYGSFFASTAMRRATRAWAALRIPVSPDTAIRALSVSSTSVTDPRVGVETAVGTGAWVVRDAEAAGVGESAADRRNAGGLTISAKSAAMTTSEPAAIAIRLRSLRRRRRRPCELR